MTKKYNGTQNILLEVSHDQWNYYYSKIKRTNLLQSWYYGQAKAKSENWNVGRCIIYDDYQQPIAIMQYLFKKFGFIKIVRINRGPLWLNEDVSIDQIKHVLSVIKRQWNRRNFSVLLLAPNLDNTDHNQKILSLLGFIKKNNFIFESGLIELEANVADLLKKLRSNWRRSLRSAEKNNLNFNISQSIDDFQWIISEYVNYQKQKSFTGPSKKILSALYDYSNEHENLWIAYVTHHQKRVASLLVASHGSTCSPLVSSLSEEGRDLSAGNFILWNSILYAKEQGHKWFDQGGLNGKEIGNFKRGIPSEEYQLIGEYISW